MTVTYTPEFATLSIVVEPIGYTILTSFKRLYMSAVVTIVHLYVVKNINLPIVSG